MAAVTRYKLAEQVLFRLGGGQQDTAAPVQHEDLYEAISQKINAKLKMEHFTVTLQQGDTIPDNLFLATYENVAVTATSDAKRSYATLPAMPASLPRNMGIFAIYKDENQFIPLQAGQRYLLKTDKLLNDLLNQIGYEPKGKKVEFTKNLPLLGISTVDMTLAVFDISQYGDTDILPIPSSMEEEIVNELVIQFSEVLPDNGVSNNFTTANQKANP